MKTVFVCSTINQAQTFLAVQRVLEADPANDCDWIALDKLFAWSCTDFLAANGVQAATPEGDWGKSGLLELGVLQQLRAVDRSVRPQMTAILKRLSPDVVVVGNDRGLLEKSVIRAARDIGAATVLVQDGLLWRHEVRRISLADISGARFRKMGITVAKAVLARLLRMVGRTDLAPSYMGQGGCDKYCVMGEGTRRILEERGTPADRLVVTGQPRYDDVVASAAPRNELRDAFGLPQDKVVVTLFGQTADPDVALAGGSTTAHYLDALTAWLDRHADATLVVKPHPREAWSDYARWADCHDRLRLVSDFPAPELARASDIVISLPSTTLAEAAIFGVTQVVIGRGVANPCASLGVDERLLTVVVEPAELIDELDGLLAGAIGTERPGDAPVAAAGNPIVYLPRDGASRCVARAISETVDSCALTQGGGAVAESA